jgi:hypothetical protein
LFEAHHRILLYWIAHTARICGSSIFEKYDLAEFGVDLHQSAADIHTPRPVRRAASSIRKAKKRIFEYRLPTPYASMYSAQDDKNGEIWAGELHSGRLRFDPKTCCRM